MDTELTRWAAQNMMAKKPQREAPISRYSSPPRGEGQADWRRYSGDRARAATAKRSAVSHSGGRSSPSRPTAGNDRPTSSAQSSMPPWARSRAEERSVMSSKARGTWRSPVCSPTGLRPECPPAVPASAVDRRVASEADAVFQLGFAGDADGSAGHGVQGDVPEAGAGHADPRREADEGSAMIGVPAALAETSVVGIVQESDVAGLGRLDDHLITFMEEFAPVDEFHGCGCVGRGRAPDHPTAR